MNTAFSPELELFLCYRVLKIIGDIKYNVCLLSVFDGLCSDVVTGYAVVQLCDPIYVHISALHPLNTMPVAVFVIPSGLL